MRRYLEGFFKAEIYQEGVKIGPIDQAEYHELEDHVAEVNIPHNTPDACYCAIVMILTKRADEFALPEMLLLEQIAPNIVNDWHAFFHEVDL